MFPQNKNKDTLKMLVPPPPSMSWSTLVLTLLLTLFGIATSFNIDTSHPIIISSGGGGHFGQSVQLVTNFSLFQQIALRYLSMFT